MLQEANVEFGTFDILSDEDVRAALGVHGAETVDAMQVRQGIKKLKNWPTFPQLYSKGELVGGLDIIKVSVQWFSASVAHVLLAGTD